MRARTALRQSAGKVVKLNSTQAAPNESLWSLRGANLLEVFGAGHPTPGSGSFIAASGALGASTLRSVALFTIKAAERNIIYRPHVAAAREAAEFLAALANWFKGATDRDSQVYHRYRQLKAQYQDAVLASLPPLALEDISVRASETLREATDLPLAVGRNHLDVAEVGLELFEHGYKGALGQSFSSAMVSVASAESAAMLASFNLGFVPEDAGWRETARREARRIRLEATKLRGALKILADKVLGKDEGVA